MSQKLDIDLIAQKLASANPSEQADGAQNLVQVLNTHNISLATALRFLEQNLDKMPKDIMVEAINPPETKPVATRPSAITTSGMPQCLSPAGGQILIIAPNTNNGETILLTGAAAPDAMPIAESIQDVLVAAVINKSRFKLKLVDIKNNKGEVLETVLQAEYDRDGMMPVRVWANTRGEAASLAAILRKAVANAVPDLVAA